MFHGGKSEAIECDNYKTPPQTMASSSHSEKHQTLKS